MKKLSAALCALGLALTLSACASNAESDDRAPEQVPDSEVENVLANPTEYEGKTISIEGAVYAEAGSDAQITTADGKEVKAEGNTANWLAYHDPYNLSQPYAFNVGNEYSVATGEYVRIFGTIKGAVDVTDSLGNASTMVMIDASNAEALSAWDGTASTVEEGTVDHDIE